MHPNTHSCHISTLLKDVTPRVVSCFGPPSVFLLGSMARNLGVPLIIQGGIFWLLIPFCQWKKKSLSEFCLMLLQPYFGHRATGASNTLSETWKNDGSPSLESGAPFGSSNTCINSQSLPRGLHKITAFPWLDNFTFSELEGTSIQQHHPFLHLGSLLAVLVSLDFSSDTDWGGVNNACCPLVLIPCSWFLCCCPCSRHRL